MKNVILKRSRTFLALVQAAALALPSASYAGNEPVDPNKVPDFKEGYSAEDICNIMEQVQDGLASNGKPYKDSRGREIDAEKVCSNRYLQTDAEMVKLCKWKGMGNPDEQAAKYCQARNLAKKAKNGTMVLMGLDAAAAAICYMEFKRKTRQLKDAEETLLKANAEYDRTIANLQGTRTTQASTSGSQNPTLATAAANAAAALADSTGIGSVENQELKMKSGCDTDLFADPGTSNANTNATDKPYKEVLPLALRAENAARTCRINAGAQLKKTREARIRKTKRIIQAEKKVTQADPSANKEGMDFVNAANALNRARDQVVQGQKAAATQGACAAAATAAGLTEVAYWAFLSREKGYSGSIKVDSTMTPLERESNMGLKAAMAAGVSIEGLRLGACYSGIATGGKFGNFICSGETRQRPLANPEIEAYDDPRIIACKDCGNAEIYESEARRLIALSKEAAIIFGAFAVVRGIAYANALGTVKNASTALTDLMSTATTTSTGGVSGGGAPTGYAATAGMYSTGTQAIDRNGAVSGDLPESKLLPKGSALAGNAERLLNGMSDAALEKAAAGGAAAMVAQMASAMGAPDTGALTAGLKQAESFLAGLPGKDQGTYASTGGALPRGKSSGDVPPINMAGIFGGQGDQGPSNEGNLAFRGPAQSTDIWHADTDQNLFQIVSGKYEAVHDRVHGAH